MESRRAFLGRCGTGAAVWTALGAGGWATARAGTLATSFEPDKLAELAAFAMERAKSAGATYADIRINRYRNQYDLVPRPVRPWHGQAGRGAPGCRLRESSALAFACWPKGLGLCLVVRRQQRRHRPRRRPGRRDRQGQRAARGAGRWNWRRHPHTKTPTGPPSPSIRSRCRSRRSSNCCAPLRPRPWRSRGSSR